MENAADALKIAGAVLIFVLAISITIFAFGQARQASDTIIDYRDRESYYDNREESEVYYGINLNGTVSGLSRTVSFETIIPAIFRAYWENYKIVFVGLNKPLYRIKQKSGSDIDKYSIDLETMGDTVNNAVISNDDERKRQFIKKILYGDDIGQDGEKYFRENNVEFFDNSSSLYNQLKRSIQSGNVIKEYVGVYYEKDNPNIPDIMKKEKRIITYSIEAQP